MDQVINTFSTFLITYDKNAGVYDCTKAKPRANAGFAGAGWELFGQDDEEFLVGMCLLHLLDLIMTRIHHEDFGQTLSFRCSENAAGSQVEFDNRGVRARGRSPH